MSLNILHLYVSTFIFAVYNLYSQHKACLHRTPPRTPATRALENLAEVTPPARAHIAHEDLFAYLNIFLRSKGKGLQVHEDVVRIPLAALDTLVSVPLP